MNDNESVDGAVALLGRSFGVTTFADTVRRLPESTRALAARVLAGEYGRAMRHADFTLSSEDDAIADPELRAAKAVLRIAEKAPLRIMPGERLAGAAPLVEAANHRKPVAGVPGTSHTTVGFEEALSTGLKSVRARIGLRREHGNLSESQVCFLDAMECCLDAMALWHRRLMDELGERIATSDGLERQTYAEVRAGLEHVPDPPPRTFREALQGLWFLWEFQRLCGNWSGLGRVDKILGPYLRRDLASGRIDLDTARDLIAHFWIKGAEWTGAPTGHVGSSGDAQFYQNVILGGIDQDGCNIENEVTYLVLDVVEELHISDFPVAVRVSERTSKKLWRRIAEVQRLGGGIVSIYNEDLVIRSMVGFGYPEADAREFTNDGCWEIIVPGKTAFGYRPFDLLPAFQTAMKLDRPDDDAPDCPAFEDLYRRFREAMAEILDGVRNECGQAFSGGAPSPLLSLFVEDCIERATPYHNRGARYSVRSPHAGGMPDTANSLFAVKCLVYDEQRLTLAALRDILLADWEGHDELRRQIRRDLTLYGNDRAEPDAMLQRVYTDYVDLCRETPSVNGVLTPPGISTFGREIAFRSGRTAQPFGAKCGDILASNLAPTPGTDRQGPTAVVRSFCKLDFERLTCGTPLDLKFHPGGLRGAAGLRSLVALLKTFVNLGGMYVQVDVVDSEVLRDAQKYPERYPNLAVRVSGWSARFTTLDKTWQDMIIRRTEPILTR
jgi:formate C-acetyltransferase